MNIPFVDFRYQTKMSKLLTMKAGKVLSKGNFILGSEVLGFEKNFARFSKHKYAVGVSNGTDALFLAIKSLDLKSGDEVIIPAHTFIATTISAHLAGVKIKLCDVDPKNWLLDLSKLKQVITPKTKLIIPVHIYGHGVNINKLKKIIGKKNIKIIEDASQAQGLNHHSKNVFKGDISIFSLYPAKNLGACGDAGIIITNKLNIYNKLLKLRNWGSVKKYVHDEIGYNQRMDTLQAVFLNEKLKRLKLWNKQRISAAKIYLKNLKGIGDLRFQCDNAIKNHVYHLFVIKTRFRDSLQKFLNENKIATLIHYPKAIHQHKAFKNFGFAKKKYKVAENLVSKVLSLPIYPGMNRKNIELISNKIKDFYNKNEK